MHAIPRGPRVQDGVSSCRLGTCATAAAGKRYGTAGPKIGPASLTWACAEATGLLRRHHAQGQKLLARVEPQHGQGQAWTILAHTWARAVYDMLPRDPVFEMARCLNGSGSRAGAPAASLDTHGRSRKIRP